MTYAALDVNTEKGQVTLAQEKRAVEIYEALNSDGHTFIGTKKKTAALVDGFLVADLCINGVVETKCRNLSYREFMTDFGGSWLVTWEKIQYASVLATHCSVPLYGFLYLVPSDCLLVQQITTDRGLFIPEIKLAATMTQKTVNGGSIIRNNAYINMRSAVKYKFD